MASPCQRTGKWLGSTGPDPTRVWDVAAGKERHALPVQVEGDQVPVAEPVMRHALDRREGVVADAFGFGKAPFEQGAHGVGVGPADAGR